MYEFIDQKINFKQKCDICYKFHITRYRTTCIKCELSLCKLCAEEYYNHKISQMNNEPLAAPSQSNDRKIIDQLLKE